MSPATVIGIHRRIHGSAETGGESPQSVERLTAETRAVLDRFGVRWSGSKVSRVVRAYVHTVQGNRSTFADYVADQIMESEHQRRVVADELRKVTAHVDPVGERAVNNVLRSQGRRR